MLVEQERAALAASPEALADPRGAQLSQAAEHLSRLLAVTVRDVRAADEQAGPSPPRRQSPHTLGAPVSVIVDLILVIVTSIGGFVEVGSISTSAQAGSEFGFQLLWAVAAAGLVDDRKH